MCCQESQCSTLESPSELNDTAESGFFGPEESGPNSEVIFGLTNALGRPTIAIFQNGVAG